MEKSGSKTFLVATLTLVIGVAIGMGISNFSGTMGQGRLANSLRGEVYHTRCAEAGGRVTYDSRDGTYHCNGGTPWREDLINPYGSTDVPETLPGQDPTDAALDGKYEGTTQGETALMVPINPTNNIEGIFQSDDTASVCSGPEQGSGISDDCVNRWAELCTQEPGCQWYPGSGDLRGMCQCGPDSESPGDISIYDDGHVRVSDEDGDRDYSNEDFVL